MTGPGASIAAAVRRLKPEELRAVCEPATLPFASTETLPPLDSMLGQDRALGATTFGIRMKHRGYNLFALGPSATGKTTTMRRLLDEAAAAEPVPSDWCYVHNFVDASRPRALEVPAGRGRELREALERFVEECKVRLPRAFESEEFERRKSEILEELARQQSEEIAKVESAAREAGFVLVRTPGGMAVAPAPEGRPLNPEQFEALPEPVRDRLGAALGPLESRLEVSLRQIRQFERAARAAHEALVRDIAAAATRALVQELRDDFAGIDAVRRYLDQVEEDLVAHAEDLRRGDDHQPALPFLPPPAAFMDRYRVNVLVDRADARGAPVVFERNPTHGNLLGRVEHRPQFGTLVTDFTLIKGGALHRANGGYLVLDAKDVLRTFMAWESLKKALKARAIRIEEPLEELRLISTVTLAPEPIPLDVKVVLIGNPLLYYLLYELDEDFRELFKVKVDFDDSLPRTAESEALYGRFGGTACREEGLRHFSAGGLARLVEHGSRLISHQGRLSARLGLLLDVVREASFCAEQGGRALVEAQDVTRAIEQRIYRASLLEERAGRLIAEGTQLVDTEGEAVGQVNGISVLVTGDHAFGRPSRITARTYAGAPGVVDIEREAKLGGRVHSKGVMILTGFLAGRFASDRPLALSASLAFEQQYEEIDGDSASSAELYALLSSLAGVPVSQAIAVTGSINQQGEIQPVGGVNEKIEGFFDVCRARGLTGRQGVVIPAANVRHLMLRPAVVEAVRAERFHVWAVTTVDEGIELLTGRPAASVYAAVEQALARNVERLRQLRTEAPTVARKEDGT
ncbi:MAG TPA: ATP-binding protein [Methylomirabilota bacterium]|nr:ATP-binding protein [Methylomirabilota bacterium]